MEKYKPIKGFEGFYEVSNLGNVRSLDRTVSQVNQTKRVFKGKVLTPVNSNGYERVSLVNTRKKYKKATIHRLVAEAFIPNPDNRPQVNHINEIKHDNRVENLEWVTQKQNNNHGTRMSKIAEANKNSRLCKEVYMYEENLKLIKVWKSTKEIARRTNFNQGNIAAYCRGESNYCYGYIWSYTELSIIRKES